MALSSIYFGKFKYIFSSILYKTCTDLQAVSYITANIKGGMIMSRSKYIQAIDITQRDRYITQPNYYRKPYTTLWQKIRNGNAQAVFSNGCSSMRSVCDNIQSVACELNQLLNSIEHLLPLLNTYLLQPKETISITREEPNKVLPPSSVMAESAKTENNSAPKQLRAEDLQQLLENPLVKSLLTGVLQNNSSRKNQST